MKKLWVAGTVVLCAVLAMPATAQQAKPMRLTLNFLAGGPQAGFMLAKKLGYYKDAGIDLTIEEGKGSATTAQQVATGQTKFVVHGAKHRYYLIWITKLPPNAKKVEISEVALTA